MPRSTIAPVRELGEYRFGIYLQPREMYDRIDRLVSLGYTALGRMVIDGWVVCVSPCGGRYCCFIIETGHVYSFSKNFYQEW
jgi:hypothetical protein